MDEPALPQRIEIEFPDPLPITDEELVLIETHLNAIVAAVVEMDAGEPR